MLVKVPLEWAIKWLDTTEVIKDFLTRSAHTKFQK